MEKLAAALLLGCLACSGGESHAEGDGQPLTSQTPNDTTPAQVVVGPGSEHANTRDEHAAREGRDEHAGEREHNEPSRRGDDESGRYIGRMDTWDSVRNGAQLILAYDEEVSAFVGTVENTTQHTLCGVRVEVHLSTGIALGPTPRIDLRPDERRLVQLETGGQTFQTWTAHPEMSPCSGGA